MSENLLPFKKTVNERLKDHLTESEEAIKAALVNERVTRHRVDQIEAVLKRGLLGRFRWLVMGR